MNYFKSLIMWKELTFLKPIKHQRKRVCFFSPRAKNSHVMTLVVLEFMLKDFCRTRTYTHKRV